jgi:hypothetical protein
MLCLFLIINELEPSITFTPTQTFEATFEPTPNLTPLQSPIETPIATPTETPIETPLPTPTISPTPIPFYFKEETFNQTEITKLLKKLELELRDYVVERVSKAESDATTARNSMKTTLEYQITEVETGTISQANQLFYVYINDPYWISIVKGKIIIQSEIFNYISSYLATHDINNTIYVNTTNIIINNTLLEILINRINILEYNLTNVQKGININNVAESSSSSSLFDISVSGTVLGVINSVILVIVGIIKLIQHKNEEKKMQLRKLNPITY